MPFLLIVLGALFLVLGYQGTQAQFFALLKSDFTGPGNFWYWLVAIVMVGGLGYIPGLQGLSRAFLLLILVALFLKNGTGFFAQLNQSVAATGSAQPGSTMALLTGSSSQGITSQALPGSSTSVNFP